MVFETCAICGIKKQIEAFIGYNFLKPFTGVCIDCQKKRVREDVKMLIALKKKRR